MITILNARSLPPLRDNVFRAYCGRPQRGTALGDNTPLGIYVGLGNPFNTGTRDEKCDNYARHTPLEHMRRINRLQEIHQQQDIELVCWCAPARCHCETIKHYIES